MHTNKKITPPAFQKVYKLKSKFLSFTDVASVGIYIYCSKNRKKNIESFSTLDKTNSTFREKALGREDSSTD